MTAPANRLPFLDGNMEPTLRSVVKNDIQGKDSFQRALLRVDKNTCHQAGIRKSDYAFHIWQGTIFYLVNSAA